jgi:predicted XRE-type DNA-binding protein
MILMPTDEATIQSLRRDLALQVSRAVRRLGATQRVAATRLGLPQPTVSKLLNGRVDNLSIELLLRVAVRAGLSLSIHIGDVPEEAGVSLSISDRQRSDPRGQSSLNDVTRRAVKSSDGRLTPSQRLEAFLEHNQLLAELHRAGRDAEKLRADAAARRS